ncbi:MAG: alpha/beta hydrolase [Oscillospiraceae bacterium]|nr:alpha/beta hydrolase [Oscillospiraceae bacterium]
MKKSTKRALITAGVIGATASATYMLIGNAFYYVILTKRGLNSNFSKKRAGETNNDQEYKRYLNGIMEEDAKWFDSAHKEKIVIRSGSGRKNIHADYIFADSPSDTCVVLVHGYTSSPRNMGIYAKKYHEEGYDVLLPSLNGHADSESGLVTMGWKDRLDVIDWINYLTESRPNIKIIIHGVSMGAATVMMTTGEELPENVKVAVADCGYTTVWDIFSHKLTNDMKLPEFPILYSANSINRIVAGYDFKKASSIEQLKKSKTPTIFIHGEMDNFVPYGMLDEVYNAAACEKEKVTIPNAPHARNACADPELYWNSVLGFIKKYL